MDSPAAEELQGGEPGSPVPGTYGDFVRCRFRPRSRYRASQQAGLSSCLVSWLPVFPGSLGYGIGIDPLKAASVLGQLGLFFSLPLFPSFLPDFFHRLPLDLVRAQDEVHVLLEGGDSLLGHKTLIDVDGYFCLARG